MLVNKVLLCNSALIFLMYEKQASKWCSMTYYMDCAKAFLAFGM